MSDENEFPAEWKGNLEHMLGATSDVPKGRQGYRNYFCANSESSDYGVMLEMEKAGLVMAGHRINGNRDQYFFATEAGCKAIKLSKAATKRAFDGE